MGSPSAGTGVGAHQSGSTVTVTAAADLIGDPGTVDAVDLLCQYGVAIAAARSDRAILHAAALARADGAIVVVGSSGAGKSSLAAAAWSHGWSLLADDLVVVTRRDERVWVRGIRRPPLLPDELLDRAQPAAALDERSRRRLPVEVLLDEARPVVGVVAVGHDTGDGRVIDVDEGERVATLIHGLAVPPVAPVMTAHLPMLAALGGLPLRRLTHARDADRRSVRAAALLDEIGRLVGA